MNDEPTITDNPGRHRFELAIDGEVAAFSEYNVLQGALLFTHTEVQPAFEGRGLAGKLVAFALDDVRKRGLRVVPACPFVSGYIRKHPEYLDLVSEESRRAFLR